MGMRLPAMPLKNSDGDAGTSTIASRASYCSERLRVKRGQAWAPGIIGASAASIWQPLHTPSAKVSLRAKNAAKPCSSAGLKRMLRAQPSPAPSTSP